MPPDPYKYFRIEARELLEQLGQGALDLEKATPSAETCARLLRLAHTLKGAARVVKQPEIAAHAHRLEDVFAALRQTPRQPARGEIDEMLAWLDAMSARLATLTPEAAASAAAAKAGATNADGASAGAASADAANADGASLEADRAAAVRAAPSVTAPFATAPFVTAPSVPGPSVPGPFVTALDDGTLVADTFTGSTFAEDLFADATFLEVEPPMHTGRPESADVQRLVDGIAEAQTTIAGMRPAFEEAARARHLLDLVDHQLGRLQKRDRGPASDRGEAREGGPHEKLLSLVRDVRGRMGGLERRLQHGLDHVERDLRGMGETAARLRLTPAAGMFRFLERAVRDAGQALGVRVRFEGRGGDIGVDSDLLNGMQGALLHLVRNAVAHGIEPPAARLAAGKPAEGLVTVTIARSGRGLSFACADDGRGVDLEAVRRVIERAAQASAAASAATAGKAGGKAAGESAGEAEPALDQEAPLDQEALLARLLVGGISTSARLTDMAGRGVGLDVARTAAERLGGDLRMRSEAGRGVTVTLDVPATIASFRALVVETARITAAIPLDAVRGARRLTPADVTETPHGDTVPYDGRAVRLTSLRRLIHPGDPDARARQTAAFSAFILDISAAAAPAAAAATAGHPGAAAFIVDRIVGIATIVMRPLPECAPAARCVAGVTLGPRGEAQLVLDPPALVAGAHEALAPRAPAVATPPPTILVIDDSLTTRMLEQSILETAGYDVQLATSAEEALTMARARRYALFLVDVEMPGMDGFTFIEQTRVDPALRHIPAILVTSRASADDRRRGREVGAQGYIEKSDFDQTALLARISSLLS